MKVKEQRKTDFYIIQQGDGEMTVKDIAEALMSFGEDCEPKPEEGKIKNSTNETMKKKHFSEITFT